MQRSVHVRGLVLTIIYPSNGIHSLGSEYNELLVCYEADVVTQRT